MKQSTKTTIFTFLLFALTIASCKKENLTTFVPDSPAVKMQDTRVHQNDLQWPEGTAFADAYFFLPEGSQFLSMDANGAFKLSSSGEMDATGFLKEEGILLDMHNPSGNIGYWEEVEDPTLLPQKYLKHPMFQEELEEAEAWLSIGLAFSDIEELSGEKTFYVGNLFGHLVICELPSEAGEAALIFKPHVNFSYTTGPCGVIYTDDPLVGEIIETATGKRIPFYGNEKLN